MSPWRTRIADSPGRDRAYVRRRSPTHWPTRARLSRFGPGPSRPSIRRVGLAVVVIAIGQILGLDEGVGYVMVLGIALLLTFAVL